jgi:NADPH2:quinone reductase
MTANVALHFVLIYGIGSDALAAAADGVNAAAAAGALSELPIHPFDLDRIAAAQDAVEHGISGKALIDLR